MPESNAATSHPAAAAAVPGRLDPVPAAVPAGRLIAGSGWGPVASE
ncbi:MAG TPA: hypothetical protein VMW75_18250 [Thermoanaerobaculia bacterium]|nr:hypothetical protein [Thermoanaerobaculia bacterium]